MTQSKGPVAAVLDSLRGGQLKPTVILLSSAVLMLAWWHFGSPEFYGEHFAPYWTLWENAAATAAVYSFVASFLLLGAVPALIVKLLLRERLADYGVGFGVPKYTIRSFLILAPLFVLFGYTASLVPAVREYYPINRQTDMPAGLFGFNTCMYVLFYLGWEFHFRGFLQFGLRDSMGPVNAVLVQVMASSLLHIGKPTSEAFASIAAGILWGILAFRTRSLLSGLLQHAILGITLDWCICYM